MFLQCLLKIGPGLNFLEHLSAISKVWLFDIAKLKDTFFSGPDAPPSNLMGKYVNSTAIMMKWGLVPEEDRNGIIRRYVVSYRAKGGLLGWKEIAVVHPTSALCIAGLQKYTIYEIKILAETSINRGPFSNVTEVRTDADGK